jgi:hypothetical protein
MGSSWNTYRGLELAYLLMPENKHNPDGKVHYTIPSAFDRFAVQVVTNWLSCTLSSNHIWLAQASLGLSILVRTGKISSAALGLQFS